MTDVLVTGRWGWFLEDRRGVVVGVGELRPEAPWPALDWAAVQARRWTEPLDVVVLAAGPAPSDPTGGETGVEQVARSLLVARARARALAPDLDVRVRTARGVFGDDLLQAAAGARLLVTGPSAADRGFTGRVRWSALQAAGRYAAALVTCPTVHVFGRVPTERGDVVAADDGSPTGAAAVEFAADQAYSTSAVLRLVRTWCPPAGVRRTRSAEEQRLRHGQRATAAAVVAARPGLEVRTVLERTREPASALVRRSHAAALVVLGARSRAGVAGALLGSTARAVAAEAPCPVAVVPTASSWREPA